MTSFFKKSSNETAVSKFRDPDDRLITYEDLSKIPLNQTVDIVKGIKGAIECTRISSTNETSLMFTVTMKAGQIWEKHHHDCFEICVVYKGELLDLISGKSAKTAQAITFDKYVTHFVKANKDTIFYVEFKKP